MNQWSVRSRLTAAATLAIAVLLSLTAILLVWRVQSALLDGLDQDAQQQAAAAAAAVKDARGGIFPTASTLTGVGQIIDSSGRVVAASSEIEGEPRLYDFRVAPVGSSPRIHAVRLSQLDDAEYRVAGVKLPGVRGDRLYLGLPLAEVNRSTNELATALAVGLPILLAILALLTWLYAGKAMQPVDELLARLDGSLRRQRQFVADAAHELRSPVAAIRAQLEVAEAEGNPAVDSLGGPDRKAALLDESVRLSGLVDDLLALARIDAEPELRREPVDLDDVVYAEVQLLRQRANVLVDTSRITPVQVNADSALLRRAVRNLLDNAARYAESRITVTLGADGSDAKVSVADDGPGIPPEHRAAVLQRFSRLDEARTRDTGGVGLGLAIVRDVVAAHHGRLEIGDNTPGAVITFWLPRGSSDGVPPGLW